MLGGKFRGWLAIHQQGGVKGSSRLGLSLPIPPPSCGFSGETFYVQVLWPYVHKAGQGGGAGMSTMEGRPLLVKQLRSTVTAATTTAKHDN